MEEPRRREIAALGRALAAAGLLSLTAGNISARAGTSIVITPSGIPYDDTDASDVVVCSLKSGAIVDGRRRPSSELPLHRAIYAARPDVGAIVHTHSRFATTLAVLRQPIPAVHYMIARLAADAVPVVGYATYGSDELAGLVRETLAGGAWAALLANHGAIALGRDLTEAGLNAQILEDLAETYWRARTIGEPFVLDADELRRVGGHFETYGQP